MTKPRARHDHRSRRSVRVRRSVHTTSATTVRAAREGKHLRHRRRAPDPRHGPGRRVIVLPAGEPARPGGHERRRATRSRSPRPTTRRAGRDPDEQGQGRRHDLGGDAGRLQDRRRRCSPAGAGPARATFNAVGGHPAARGKQLRQLRPSLRRWNRVGRSRRRVGVRSLRRRRPDGAGSDRPGRRRGRGRRPTCSSGDGRRLEAIDVLTAANRDHRDDGDRTAARGLAQRRVRRPRQDVGRRLVAAGRTRSLSRGRRHSRDHRCRPDRRPAAQRHPPPRCVDRARPPAASRGSRT